MLRHRVRSAAVLTLVLGLALASGLPGLQATADTLPSRLTTQEWWKLSEDLSEPGGYFRSDNLLSNELYYPAVIDGLVRRASPASVYLGVGPEQNFNYIAALKPKMAFITDIRRGNLHTHLMYKALFELSADRADFVSRLFTKPRPAGLTRRSTATEIMDAYAVVDTGLHTAYQENLKILQRHLTVTRKLPLSAEDLEGIDYVYSNFYWFGPSITYSSSTNSGFGFGRRGGMATYYDLMLATDDAGAERSYLATEDSFAVIKNLHARNLIVPVVGNFGGPKALRAVGAYVRARGAVVSAFYLSNVEQYLNQDGLWMYFCANVASMPLDERSTFIRSATGYGGRGGGFRNELGWMQTEVQTRGCAGAIQGGTGPIR